jgi:hypothetical protein
MGLTRARSMLYQIPTSSRLPRKTTVEGLYQTWRRGRRQPRITALTTGVKAALAGVDKFNAEPLASRTLIFVAGASSPSRLSNSKENAISQVINASLPNIQSTMLTSVEERRSLVDRVDQRNLIVILLASLYHDS